MPVLLLLALPAGVHLLAADLPLPPAADAPVPPPIDWKALEDEEDRIDQLPPAEQSPALLKLRRRLSDVTSVAGQAVQQRLSLKLTYVAALADLQSAPADHPPPYAGRLLISRQAADIGATYLKQNDPARALTWETRSRAIAPASLWPDDLRNQVHAWYETRLTDALTADNWSVAREVLAAWKKQLATDSAVQDGIEQFARARANDLIRALDTTDPRTVLSRLTTEEIENPDARAWQLVRNRVAAALDRDFQVGLTGRNIPAAQAALELQTAIAREYNFPFERAPVASNALQLEALIRDLQPSPIQRDGGHVRAVQFRIEVTQTLGTASYRHRDLKFRGVTWFPFAVGDWRIYNGDTNPWWFGFNMTGMQNNAGKDFSPVSRFTTEGFFLFGRRSATWSGSLGVGGVFNQLSFGDKTIQKFNVSRSLSAALRLDGEWSLGTHWTVYGTGEIGGGPGVGIWQIKFGARYFFNHNFAVGLHGLFSEVTVGPDGAIRGYHNHMNLLGPSMLMQF